MKKKVWIVLVVIAVVLMEIITSDSYINGQFELFQKDMFM